MADPARLATRRLPAPSPGEMAKLLDVARDGRHGILDHLLALQRAVVRGDNQDGFTQIYATMKNGVMT
jgi:hypothetical protein